MKSEGGFKDQAAASEHERNGSSGRKRHNVYVVWLTPQTKICESNAQSERPGAGQTQSLGDKREVALDQLEVGDHVEVQFTRREDSGASQSVHQTEAMRRTHGRHRTYVGHAASITILPEMGHEQARPANESRLNERSRSNQ
jgi:hypothetical protein